MATNRKPNSGRGGLAWKLIALQMLWMLPALGVADYFVLWEETRRLERGLDEGRLEAVAAEMAAELEIGGSDTATLQIALDRHRLLLERARGGLAQGAGHILQELSEQPLALQLQHQDGVQIAHSGPALRDGESAELLRRVDLPLQLADGTPARLIVQLAVPRPGLSLLQPRSFEGSILLLTAFALALSGGLLLSVYLGRRLGRIRQLVQAWRQGELDPRIGPAGRDELGVLAGDLDGMAADLQRLLQDRARLGALEERQRVARDLHDTVKQKAFALGLQLGALRRALREPSPALAEAERLASEIRDELALVVDTMRPQERPKEAFRARLDERARRWQLATGLELVVSCSPGPEPDPATAEQLLRISDEALANISRHAGPCSARVQLSAAADGHWQLQISDSGCGFDPNSANGRGLQHLRERSHSIGGFMQIDSRVGRGTRVTLDFPLTLEPGAAASHRWRQHPVLGDA
jgi:signal transduction histidine kinase